MNEPTLNPADGTAIITLRDGQPRKFDLDAEAMILAEDAAGGPSLLNPGAALFWGSVRGIRALLYGGLHRDASSRKELGWSPQRVAELMDPRDLPLLNHLCGWALRVKIMGPEAVRAPGEAKAARKKPTAKPSRGPGRESSRRAASI